jgi:hypothetical protein
MVTKLKSLLTSVLAELKDIWQRSKMYLLGIAAILAAIEFQKIKEMLLVYLGKKEIVKATKEDAALATQENQANQQADALVTQAGQETAADDWNKK